MALGIIQRLINGTVAPYAARMPKDETVQLVAQQLVGVASAIKILTKVDDS